MESPEETPATPCPTPWKMVFDSRREARNSIGGGRSKSKIHAQLYPYHCQCGRWHLTSMDKRTARRIKKTRKL